MPYQIIITLEDEKTTTDTVKDIGKYVNEIIGKMYPSSYSVDCYKDGIKIMMGMESSAKE